MSEAFAVHRELGRFFHEAIYQQELMRRLGPAATAQVPISLSHQSFRRTLFVDLLAWESVVLELKAVDKLLHRHRAQLLNYLFALDIAHGKLINFGRESVEHEFVNTSLTCADRRRFLIDEANWDRAAPGARVFVSTLCELLADWGIGLDRRLYEAALVQILGGEVTMPVEGAEGSPVGVQRVCLVQPGVAFRVTTFRTPPPQYGRHCRQFVQRLALDGCFWANLTLGKATFRWYRRGAPPFPTGGAAG